MLAIFSFLRKCQIRNLGCNQSFYKDDIVELITNQPESFFSPSRGSNQRLPNGNTFIADSDNGRLFEVTYQGEIVWEFFTPDLTKSGRRMPLYRTIRYSTELIDELRVVAS